MSDLSERWARLLADGKVRWMRGMISVDGRVCVAVGGDGRPYLTRYADSTSTLADLSVAPDWTNPATLGCLLAMVRERYPDATTQTDSGRWWVAARDGRRLGAGQTEAGALLAAIEART